MIVTNKASLINTNIIYTARWFLNSLSIVKLRKLKTNKKSIKFLCKEETFHFNKNGEIEARYVYEYTITISFDNILYSKIPYFTTREEVIDYLISEAKYQLEKAKYKLQTLPSIINNLTRIKEEEVTKGE